MQAPLIIFDFAERTVAVLAGHDEQAEAISEFEARGEDIQTSSSLETHAQA